VAKINDFFALRQAHFDRLSDLSVYEDCLMALCGL